VVRNEEATKPLWRAVRGELPRGFWLPDEAGMVCAVEMGFMSTSRMRETPINYMDESGPNVLWALQPKDQTDEGYHCGADISRLSQFRGEEEVLFPPCTLLIVQQTKHDSCSKTGQSAYFHSHWIAPSLRQKAQKAKANLLKAPIKAIAGRTHHNDAQQSSEEPHGQSRSRASSQAQVVEIAPVRTRRSQREMAPAAESELVCSRPEALISGQRGSDLSENSSQPPADETSVSEDDIAAKHFHPPRRLSGFDSSQASIVLSSTAASDDATAGKKSASRKSRSFVANSVSNLMHLGRALSSPMHSSGAAASSSDMVAPSSAGNSPDADRNDTGDSGRTDEPQSSPQVPSGSMAHKHLSDFGKLQTIQSRSHVLQRYEAEAAALAASDLTESAHDAMGPAPEVQQEKCNGREFTFTTVKVLPVFI